MQLTTSNWQLCGRLARTVRGTESRGAMAVLLALPAAGCTPCRAACGFAQTPPSLGSTAGPKRGPAANSCSRPTVPSRGITPANSGSEFLTTLPNSSANSIHKSPLCPPNAAGRDAGGELHCTPPPALLGSPSPAVLTLHPTSQATSLNTYSFKDYSNVAHF